MSRPLDLRKTICRISAVLVLGVMLVGCDKCGDWISPVRGEVCRDQRPQ